MLVAGYGVHAGLATLLAGSQGGTLGVLVLSGCAVPVAGLADPGALPTPARGPAIPEPLPPPRHPKLEHRTMTAKIALFDWAPDLFAFLRRAWVTVAISTGIMAAVGVAYQLFATPHFTASSTVYIDMQAAAPFKADNTPIDSQFANGIAESQVEVLQSDGLARVVVRRLHLADNPAFMGERQFAAEHRAWRPAVAVRHAAATAAGQPRNRGGRGADENDQGETGRAELHPAAERRIPGPGDVGTTGERAG